MRKLRIRGFAPHLLSLVLLAAFSAMAVLRAGSTASVTQRCPGTVGSPPVEQFVNPVVISPAFIIPVVVSGRRNQVAKNASSQARHDCRRP